MLRMKAFVSGLPVLAMAGLVACQSDLPENNRQVASSVNEEYKSAGEVRFLYDNEGNVPRQLPLMVLQDMRQQLQVLHQGQDALVKDLEARYDFRTGEVKDARAAERAELYLKSQLPIAAPVETPAASAPINPDQLPAGIQIPAELIDNLKQAAPQGGSK